MKKRNWFVWRASRTAAGEHYLGKVLQPSQSAAEAQAATRWGKKLGEGEFLIVRPQTGL